jgi:tRNA_anti-like
MKRILSILLVLGLAGAGIGYYLWNKPHKDMKAAKADMAIEAAQIFNEYNTDENAANAKYLDKTVAVSGTVKEAVKSDDGTVKVTLDTGQEFGVLCELDPLTQHPRSDFPPGEKATFKGTCSGFNFDVQLNRCVEVRD